MDYQARCAAARSPPSARADALAASRPTPSCADAKRRPRGGCGACAGACAPRAEPRRRSACLPSRPSR
eukprot:scaffold181480_cov33-Tisochrysis_lutea.AAC.1